MKILTKLFLISFLFGSMCVMHSCSEIEIPEHNLDVEFRYELVCSEAFLKYATPQVTLTYTDGSKSTFEIEDDMWSGTGHKIWEHSVHYDSLGVSSTVSVTYAPKENVAYQDETAFDNVHYLSCYIMVKEDGEGRRNNYTVVPDYPTATNVTAAALETYMEGLNSQTTIRGGKVDSKGEITKIENE